MPVAETIVNASFFEAQVIRSSKDRFINKLAITPEQKSFLSNFFKENPTYESFIDWQNPNLTWDDFADVLRRKEVSRKSKAGRRKEASKVSEEALRGEATLSDIFSAYKHKVWYEDENMIFVSPLNHECAVFMDSEGCYGVPAHWCIGTSKTPYYWNKYVTLDGGSFVMFYKRPFDLSEVNKYMFHILADGSMDVWNYTDFKSQKSVTPSFVGKVLGVSPAKFKFLSTEVASFFKENVVAEDEGAAAYEQYFDEALGYVQASFPEDEFPILSVDAEGFQRNYRLGISAHKGYFLNFTFAATPEAFELIIRFLRGSEIVTKFEGFDANPDIMLASTEAEILKCRDYLDKYFTESVSEGVSQKLAEVFKPYVHDDVSVDSSVKDPDYSISFKYAFKPSGYINLKVYGTYGDEAMHISVTPDSSGAVLTFMSSTIRADHPLVFDKTLDIPTRLDSFAKVMYNFIRDYIPFFRYVPKFELGEGGLQGIADQVREGFPDAQSFNSEVYLNSVSFSFMEEHKGDGVLITYEIFYAADANSLSVHAYLPDMGFRFAFNNSPSFGKNMYSVAPDQVFDQIKAVLVTVNSLEISVLGAKPGVFDKVNPREHPDFYAEAAPATGLQEAEVL